MCFSLPNTCHESTNKIFSVSHVIHMESPILYLLSSCTGVTTDNNSIHSKWNNTVKSNAFL